MLLFCIEVIPNKILFIFHFPCAPWRLSNKVTRLGDAQIPNPLTVWLPFTSSPWTQDTVRPHVAHGTNCLQIPIALATILHMQSQTAGMVIPHGQGVPWRVNTKEQRIMCWHKGTEIRCEYMILIRLARETDQYQAFVNMVTNLRVPKKARKSG
jgi:hypothetical protein